MECTGLSANQPSNTHRVSFRFTTSYIHFSSVQSTRCQIILLAGRPTSAAFTLRLLIAHSYLISQSIAKVHLHSSAVFVPFGKFTPAASYGAGIAAATWLSFFSLSRKVAAALLPAPSWGLAGPSIRSSFQCLMAARHPGYSADKCAAQLSFFFAAGAFTSRPTHNFLFQYILTFAKNIRIALLPDYYLDEE